MSTVLPSLCTEMTESWKISEKTREPNVLPGISELGISYKQILADFRKRLRLPSSTECPLKCTDNTQSISNKCKMCKY